MTHLIKHPQPGGGVGCLPEKDVCITSGHLSLLWPFFGSRIALLWPQYISRKKNQLREAGISVFKTICPKAHSRSLKSLLSKEAWPLISSLCAKGPQHYNNLWAPQYQIFFVCSFKTYHLLTLFKKSKVQKIINMKR